MVRHNYRENETGNETHQDRDTPTRTEQGYLRKVKVTAEVLTFTKLFRSSHSENRLCMLL